MFRSRDWQVDLRYSTDELSRKVDKCRLTPKQREALLPDTGEDGGFTIPEPFATEIVRCHLAHGGMYQRWRTAE